ncbi:Hypothetical protein A7982_03223 [Minicystis rosea]|nr:Hypothetical protein A7982_03223 [Minicystis rosea]
MRTVEQIVEQIRAASGADFAFVLTRKGRLVTHRAPRDMPEEGRARLVRAARPLLGTDRVIEVTVPREEIVPYGGAAPVDVYLGVVAEQAIICVVMATWADKLRVAPAIEAGMRSIAPLLKRGLPSTRRAGADVEPAKGSPYHSDRAPHASTPPSESPPFVDLRASLIPEIPRGPSLPEISLGEASLGRASLAAIGRDIGLAGSLPDIAIGEAPLGRASLAAIGREAGYTGSLPEISIGEASLGRASLAAIGREVGHTGSLPEISIGEASLGRASLAAIGREAGHTGSLPEISIGEASLGRASLAAIGREAGRTGSLPDIAIGETSLGRESLAAIRREGGGAAGSQPDITVSEAALGRESLAAIRRESGATSPDISLGEASLGRESLAAIELERGPRQRPASSPEGIRVELVSTPDAEAPGSDRLTLPWAEPPVPVGRATLPWVEPPVDAKRASDAARLGRKLAPPKMTIKLEDADAAVLEVAKARPTAKR